MTGEELQKLYGSKYILEHEKPLELIAFNRIARWQTELIAQYEEYYGIDISKSVAKIDAVLDAGYEVFIAYVHRPAINAFSEGVIPRALSLLKSSQPPRTVPISAHVKIHTDCPLIASQIYEKYKNNSKFHLQIFDNSFAEGKATLVPLSFLESQLYTEQAKESLTQKLHEIANQKFKDGIISEKIYKSFIVQPQSQSTPEGKRSK